MRLLSIALFIAGFAPFVSCTSDPDLDPQPRKPPTASSQLPHNRPIAGQGGGQMSALPTQPRR